MKRAMATVLCLIASGCGGGCSSPTPPAVPVPVRVAEKLDRVSDSLVSGLSDLSARLMRVERELQAFVPAITGRVDGLEGRVKALEKRLNERDRAEWVLPESEEIREEL